MSALINKIQKIEQQMNRNFVDRDGEIRAILLGVLAQKNVLFIGVPGVAKSSVIDQFIHSFAADIQSFTRLISPTTQPEELFGSARFDKLKEGIIERNVEGQLPVAHFAFLDEIFKSTSDLLNGLLKIMNEHRFENGTQHIDSPLFTLIGASNEFPEDSSLVALYDRFLIRREVQAIKTPQSLIEMLLGDTQKVQIEELTLQEIQQLQLLTEQVEMPQSIIELLAEIHFELKDLGVEVSDRRTKQCLAILKATAVLDNRTTVIQADLSSLVDCLWNEADERIIVEDLLHNYTKTPSDYILLKMESLIEELQQYFKNASMEVGKNFQAIANFGEDCVNRWQDLEQEFYIEESNGSEKVQQLKNYFYKVLAKEVL